MKPSDWIATVRGEAKEEKAAIAVPEVVELLNMKDHTSRLESTVTLDRPIFQPNPSQVIFSKYEPFKVYTQKLYLRNNDSVSRRVRIVQPDSAHFSVSYPKKIALSVSRSTGKLAPGTTICFVISFKPHEIKDYACDLVCITEREKFIVPVRATGKRPCLDLPDEVQFGTCAVKVSHENVILVRNIGDKDATFKIRTSMPFSAKSKSTIVKVGQVTQIVLGFYPRECGEHKGELTIIYTDSGQQIGVELVGTGKDVDIALEKDCVDMASQYLSLRTHKKMLIHNKSAIPVNFSWKMCPDETSEEGDRVDFVKTLVDREKEEKKSLDETLKRISQCGDEGVSSKEYEEVLLECREKITSIESKYKGLRFRAKRDPKRFTHNVFAVEPLQGMVAPNGSVEVTITFAPLVEQKYVTTAFLDVAGRARRLPMRLEGEGLGPQASFSGKLINMGDIFINTTWSHRLKFDNRAAIPCAFSLVPPTSSIGKNIVVTPSSGVLAVNESQKLQLSLCSDLIGEIDERLRFKMEGAKKMIEVRVKGHVVGPTFHFDVDSIDFGPVSYGFKHLEPICLYNTSEIPMTFRLRVPQDSKNEEPEFRMHPPSGTIEAGDRLEIEVVLTSRTLKSYDYLLTIDVEGVGRDLLSIPVYAQSLVPEVSLATEELRYGNCFIRYPYKRKVTLVNESDELRARYEILPQIQHTKIFGTFTPKGYKGIIEPGCKADVDVSLVCARLGPVSMPVYVRIEGSEKPPLVPKIKAICIGPIVKPSKYKLDWGKTPCLHDHSRKLVLRNESPIPAKIECMIEEMRSKFRVDIVNHELGPNEDVELTLTVNLDDIVTFSDNLTVEVNEGATVNVPLVAKGDGTTMFCKEDISLVDFGYRFTKNRYERRFLLENKGQRSQVLTWINKTLRDCMAERRKRAQQRKRNPKPMSKKRMAMLEREEKKKPTCTFRVVPETIVLKPRTACYFTFLGTSEVAGAIEECIICESKMGKDQSSRTIFESRCKASFIDPLLEFSDDGLEFTHIYTKDSPAETLRKPLTFKNVSALPLSFKLKSLRPFSTDSDTFELGPGERGSVQIAFDPGYKDDRLSCRIDGKLQFVYDNHPQRDEISVVGIINYPNLDFAFTKINFGSVLNDTTKSMTMTVTNNSRIDCDYSWAFLEDEEEQRALATAKKPYIPVNQVFDILPIRSHLKAGESEDVEFLMYGHANRHFRGTCVCEVEGGPDYEVSLVGGASHVAYKIDVDELDFGELVHDHTEEKVFYITNTGKVPLDFRIFDDKITRAGVISVQPVSGRIFGNERARVTIRFCPILPERIQEKIVVQVAHFEPIELNVIGVGIYSSVVLSLPHDTSDDWESLIDAARSQLLEDGTTAPQSHRGRFLPPPTSTRRPESVPSATSASMRQVSKLESRPGTVRMSNFLNTRDDKSPFLVVELEAEAFRMRYMNYLRDILAKAEVVEDEDASVASKRPTTSRTLQSLGRASTNGDSVHDLLAASNYVVTTYYADFGNVTTGKIRKKAIFLTNTGFAPVSFTVVRTTSAQNSLFVVEPEKFSRLPDGESTKIVVKLDAPKRSGEYQEEILVSVRGGPNVLLVLKANISVPELTLSQSSVDFGGVRIGRRKVVTVAFENTSLVQARWSLRKKVSGPLAKYAEAFRMVPSSGTLQSKEIQHIQIIFTPQAGQRYQYELSLRVESSRAKKTISVRGRGRELRICFDPPSLVMDPVLPNCGPTSAVVTAKNENDFPIEFFSLDFDTTYEADEGVLRDADSQYEDPESGLLLLPPHVPGERVKLSLPSQEEKMLAEVEDGTAFDRSTKRNVLLYGPFKTKDAVASLAETMGLKELYDLAVVSLSNIVSDERRRATARWESLKALLVEAETATRQTMDEENGKRPTSSSKGGGKGSKRAKKKSNEKDEKGDLEPTVTCKKKTPTFPNVGADIVESMLWSHLKSLSASRRGTGIVMRGLDCELDLTGKSDATVEPAAATKSDEAGDKKDSATSISCDDFQCLRRAASPGGVVASDGATKSLCLFDPVVVANMLKKTLSPPSAGGLHVLKFETCLLGGDDKVVVSSSEHGTPTPSVETKATKEASDDGVASTDNAPSGEHYATLHDAHEPSIDAVFNNTAAIATENALGGVQESETTAENSAKETTEDEDGKGATKMHEERISFVRIEIKNEALDDVTKLLEDIAGSLDIAKAADIRPTLPDPFEQWIVQRPPQRLPRRLESNFRFQSADCDTLVGVAGEYLDEEGDVAWTIRADGTATSASGTSVVLRREGWSSLVEKTASEEPASSQAKTYFAVQWDCFDVRHITDASGATFRKTEAKNAEDKPYPAVASRWILQPREEKQFHVLFSPDSVGKIDASLVFEVAGSNQQQKYLLVRGISAIPAINSDPRNVFMRRAKNGPLERIRKKYVVARRRYEFGPLLIGKTFTEEAVSNDELFRMNGEEIRISNDSLFDASISFEAKLDEAAEEEFKKAIEEEKVAASRPKSKKGKKQADNSKEKEDKKDTLLASIFHVRPGSLQLAPGETKHVRVWATPKRDREYSGSLVCRVENNVDDVSFPLHCLGVSPNIVLDGPWKCEDVAETDAEATKIEEGVASSSKPPLLCFDRLLIGRTEHKEFVVKNDCALPVSWKLCMGEAASHDEISVSHTEGTLKPFDSSTVVVSFEAKSEKVVEGANMRVKFVAAETAKESEDDVATIAEASTPHVPLRLSAEAYQIVSTVRLTDDEENEIQALDFGVVRVGAHARRTIRLGNQGKYPIRYKSTIKRSHAASYFSVEPEEIDVPPGASEAVTIAFKTAHDDREVVFQDNKDIFFQVVDIRTDEVFSDFDIVVNAKSVFSKCRVVSTRGVNFGPHKFGTEGKRSFEIRNEGVFPFQFKLLSHALDLESVRPNANFPNEKLSIERTHGSTGDLSEASSKLASDVAEGVSLDLGKFFVVSPSEGTIVPNATQKVDVIFRPRGAEICRASLVVDVSSRSPHDGFGGLTCDVVGESCIPQIHTKDFESIFEEQEVVSSLDLQKNPLRKAFVEAMNTFTFGAIVPHLHSQGVKARFKISNATRIPCKVSFRVKTAAATGDSTEPDSDVFVVEPATEIFPPHEHRYVTVMFKPTTLRKYRATFEAIVSESNEDCDGSKLSFNLFGEGTMPCATVENSLDRGDDGKLYMNFGRVRAGKSKTNEIVVRNDGIVPSSVRFSILSQSEGVDSPSSSSAFLCMGAPSVTLLPGQTHALRVKYNPHVPSDDKLCANLRIDVLQNRFGTEIVSLSGQSFLDDVFFRRLDGEGDDELRFGSVYIDKVAEEEEEGEERNGVVAFDVFNRSTDTFRFSFVDHAHFSFTPSVGHIGPSGTCEIVASFDPRGESVAYAKESVPMTIVPIELDENKEEGALFWNNSSKNQRDASEDVEGEAATKSSLDEISEPAFDTKGEPREINLTATVRSGKATFECDCSRAISFRDTMMFQMRRHSFVLKNPSNTELEYSWNLVGSNNDAKGVRDPFEVRPVSGKLAPGASATCSIVFAPIDAGTFRYTARCHMPHLSAESSPLEVSLMARSRRPVCHFDIEPSDYFSRRPSDLPRVDFVDSNTRVLEIESLGTNVRNTKRFHVVNTTNAAYEFSWELLEGSEHWRCAATRGLILPGKRFEMSFEYTPTVVGHHESFWRFTIPQRRIAAVFALVGSVKEPRVHLDTPHVHFRQVLVGTQSSEIVHIVNSEHIPFSFSFDRDDAEDADSSVVRVVPSRGVVPPNVKVPISVLFSPHAEGPHNANLVCDVKNKTKSLGLNVKGEGYAVHDRLFLADSKSRTAGHGIQLAFAGTNDVDFGTATINSKMSKQIVLENSGNFNFDFVWSRQNHPSLVMNPSHGTVRSKQTVRCTLTFNPTTACTLRKVPLTCTIAGSRKYKLAVNAQGAQANLDFSFTQYDFGACFAGSTRARNQKTATLRITNNEVDRDVTLDCLFEKRSHLDVRYDPVVLAPREYVDIPFVFTPRQARVYSDVVIFEVNSLYEIKILVRGEGVPLILTLDDPSHRNIAFGSVRVDANVSRKLALVNRSRIPVAFEISADEADLSRCGISILPAGKTHVLRSAEKASFELVFNPSKRLEAFSVPLTLVAEDGQSRRLVTISGACLDADVSLDTATLPFGVVTERSSVTRRVHLQNTGDVAARFKWNKHDFLPHFDISPLSGIIAPHADVAFDVVFAPDSVSSREIRCETPRCYIEGGDTLTLLLTGTCVEQPASKELRFEARVRETESKTVSLTNPTKEDWHVRSVFRNGAWSGKEFCHVPANASADYEILYRPLLMTTAALSSESGEASKTDGSDENAHRGSLFFAMPNGKTVSYELVGTSLAPAAETLSKDVELCTPCKKQLRVDLPVRNWLNSLQRFVVSIDVDEESKRATTFVRGPSNIVVPESSTRDYKLIFEAWTPGATKARVTFTNSDTKEYVFYNVVLSATDVAAGSAGTLTFDTACRKVISRQISLDNPLAGVSDVKLPKEWWRCGSKDVRVARVKHGASHLSFEVQYCPLVPTSKPSKVPLTLDLGGDLGVYKYELKLCATPSSASMTLPFKVSLGSLQRGVFRFDSLAPESTTYSCKVGRPDIFTIPAQVTVAGASNWRSVLGEVAISFEPNALGPFSDVLTVRSDTGGEYTCVLKGECSPPLPQGPVTIRSNSATTVTFKNVFNETKTFKCVVDNPFFDVSPAEKDIAAKSRASFSVTRKKSSAGEASTGKLVIRCTGDSSTKRSASWVYYLAASEEE
eukprot:g134.t1